MPELTDSDLEALDAADPLAPFRGRFRMPPGLVYLDGNSLGPLPGAVPARLARVVEEEWGGSLIRGWNDHRWLDLPLRLGDKIARLVGAGAGEVAVADSTSINLFKLLAATLEARPGRSTLLVEEDTFPTDAYMAEGLVRLAGTGHRLRRAPAHELAERLDDDVAVVLVSHVDYRSGEITDMAELERAARLRDALVVWDLAHSAGALPLALNADGARLAVGCGYKFLNGGPGAPAFLYVAHELQATLRQPLSGWLGHADPFAFESGYRPAEGIARFLCGTPPILSMSALDEAVDLLLEIDRDALREKSMALGEVFLRLVDERCAGFGLHRACPADARRRGSQVSLAHPQAYALTRALVERGVIPDFRTPDVLRCGLGAPYLRYADLGLAVDTLRDVLATGAWDEPRFKTRSGVP